MTFHAHDLPALATGLSGLAASLRGQHRILVAVMVEQAAKLVARAADELADEVAADAAAGDTEA